MAGGARTVVLKKNLSFTRPKPVNYKGIFQSPFVDQTPAGGATSQMAAAAAAAPVQNSLSAQPIPRQETEGDKANRRGLLTPNQEVAPVTPTVPSEEEIIPSQHPPYKDDTRPIDPDTVTQIQPVTPYVAQPVESGIDIVNRLLQDPVTAAAYQEGQLRQVAAKAGSAGNGFTPAFVFEGGIYAAKPVGGGRQGVVIYQYNPNTQQWGWVPGHDNTAMWDRLKVHASGLIEQGNSQSTQPQSTSGGFTQPNVGWVQQPDGSLRAAGTTGGMSPAERYNAEQAARDAAPQTPGALHDVGVGNMRWDGTQFVGYNGAPVNPNLLQMYKPALRAAGWQFNGRIITPPQGFGQPRSQQGPGVLA